MMEIPPESVRKIEELEAKFARLASDSASDRDIMAELHVRIAERDRVAECIAIRLQDLKETNAAWLEYVSARDHPENGQLLPVNFSTAERILGVLKSTGRHMTSEEIHKALPDVAARNTIHVALSKHKRLGHVVHDEAQHLYVLAPKALP